MRYRHSQGNPYTLQRGIRKEVPKLKIIGKSEKGFILDASRDELANLVGYYWLGENKCPKIEVGDKINISSMYGCLRDMKHAEQELKGVSQTLEAISKTVLLPIPLIQQVLDTTE